MRADMTAEEELCLLLARGTLAPELRTRAFELLAERLTWDRLLARAEEHHVLPLIYRNLREIGWSSVPQPVRDELVSAFRANAARNMFFTRELACVLGILGENGIPVMPLKGVALADS